MGSQIHTTEDGVGSMWGIRLSHNNINSWPANTTAAVGIHLLSCRKSTITPHFNTPCHCMWCHQSPPQWGRGTKPKIPGFPKRDGLHYTNADMPLACILGCNLHSKNGWFMGFYNS
ncbi:hypothetical protein HPP92_006527 [Vanilla planifolia]|uniref:Uncharacterized protein n=1 Tax=Vanilla planifolia TaxID=51239 RepID=A0A835RKH4_VANPL|nr:hypothetical protein HPP92_006527 [Vanilla planifolia]